MKAFDILEVAAGAVTANPARPASAVFHDSADARLLVFRIEPGQQVQPHTSPSTVVLVIAAGSGVVSGAEGERTARAGDVIVYASGELHGMRAGDEQMVVFAVVAPRPGSR